MSNHNSYQDLNQYWNEIILFTKDVFSVYLNRIIGEGPEHSTNQHLFQDTLLHKEVMNYLSGTASANDDILGMEAWILEKAQSGMKEGLFLPLEYLCRIFGLNRFERFVITVMAASSMEPAFEKVYAFLNNDLRRNSLSADLAIKLYIASGESYEDMTACFHDNAKLNRYFLLKESNTYSGYDMKNTLRLRSEIEGFLRGESGFTDEISRFIEYYIPEEELPSVLLKDKPFEHMLRYLKQAGADRSTVFYLYGEIGIGKKLNIKHLAKKLGKSVIFLELEKLSALPGHTQSDLYSLLRKLMIYVIMKQNLLCITSSISEPEEQNDASGVLRSILDYIKGEIPLLFVTSNCPKKMNLQSNDLDVITINAAAENLEEYHDFWTSVGSGYHFETDVRLESFADRFVLTPGRIKEILEEAEQLSRWYGKAAISLEQLQRVCFDKIEHNLGKKAQKVKMVYQWDDLILPDSQKDMLKAACSQITYRYRVFTEWGFDQKMAYGKGLSLIFSGPPGTGKTMAAQIIARELGLELYKIELAGVVSKFIGETERNLNEIFEEAKKSQAIIFFDEADVLFGKRSEVKDSNDKYSNMEAAFMLQKIEEYSGIVILATNYQQNIDEAFKRRIKFLMDFPFPEQVYRRKIWLKVFPDKLPLDKDIDYDFLARHFELSGSNIKNVALNAAFFAASDNNCVGMAQIIKAVINEFTKSGKKLSKEDLGEYYMYL